MSPHANNTCKNNENHLFASKVTQRSMRSTTSPSGTNGSGGTSSLADKLRLRVCELAWGPGGTNSRSYALSSGDVPHALHRKKASQPRSLEGFYKGRLTPAGRVFLERIGMALADKAQLREKDVADAARELSKYIADDKEETEQKSIAHNGLRGGESRADTWQVVPQSLNSSHHVAVLAPIRTAKHGHIVAQGNSEQETSTQMKRGGEVVNPLVLQGALKPHVIRRIQKINSDKETSDAISSELERLRAEEEAKKREKVEKRNAIALEMRRLETERSLEEASRRREREAMRKTTLAEVDALQRIKKSEVEALRKRQLLEKTTLIEQQRLRAAAKAKEEAEARAEEAKFHTMIMEDLTRLQREESDKKQLYKEDIQEFLENYRTSVDARERRKKEEKLKDASSTPNRDRLSELHTSSTYSPSATVAYSGLNKQKATHIDLSEQASKRLKARLAAQEKAMAEFDARVAQHQALELMEEQKQREHMKESEKEKDTREARERAAFYKSRAKLVEGLKLETEIQKRRDEEKLKEKQLDRALVDEEARKAHQLEECEAAKKADAKRKFIASIEAQRKSRIDKMLFESEMSIKIGNDGDHDYSKSGFAPKRETIV